MICENFGISSRRFWSVSIAVALLAVVLGIVATAPGARPAMAETCDQPIANPDFEEGSASWHTHSAAGSPLILQEAAFHGEFGAQLGGTNAADDRLWQWVSFPNNPTNMSITFFYQVETSETTDEPIDLLSVQFLDEQEQSLVDLVHLSNRNVNGQWYRRVRFLNAEEVQRLAGRRVKLQFRGITNEAAPTAFSVDDVDLQVCTDGAPALSGLAMSLPPNEVPRDHVPAGTQEALVSFAYDNIGKADEIRLWLRDVNGVTLLDHTYDNLRGSGTKQIVFTGRDAVDGLTRSALEAGNSVTQHAERAMQATSRFGMAPYLEQAVLATSFLQNATDTLGEFSVGEGAGTLLQQARNHVRTALDAGQAAFSPSIDLAESKALIATMRDEAGAATAKVAEARAVVDDAILAFPDTVDCQFNLTNMYLNGSLVDSNEWTVGDPGLPARVHPPQDKVRAGMLRIQPAIVYTQGVVPTEAPHATTIRGRAVDAHCRPVADGTRVSLSLDNPSLGSLTPDLTTTSDGFFATSFRAGDSLGNGAVTVYARVGAAEGSGVVFLVGPPATVRVDAAAFSVTPMSSVAVLAEVRDERGQAVANDTDVSFSISPPDAGSITPGSATTSSGYAAATFVAGAAPGYVTIRAEAGGVESATVVQIAIPAATPTLTPTTTPTPSPTPTFVPAPTSTPLPPCDSSDPQQMCGGIVSVRMFEDARCDGQYNSGTDRALFGVSVSLVYPDGRSILRTTDPSGYVRFSDIRLHGDERIALLAEYPEEMVTSGLTPCDNSGTLRFLDRGDFGSFRTASVRFRAFRQILARTGTLRVAEASLCFTASYYLEPTDDGPTVYLVTDEDLSAYLDQEVEVTGSTWEIEFCRYMMPFSIEPVP